MKRVCGFFWTTADGKIGSNHGCDKMRGHDDNNDDHVCHCGARTLDGCAFSSTLPALTRTSAAEIAEQLHIALGEFAAGLKMLPTVTNMEDAEANAAELRAAATIIHDNVHEFLSRLIAQGMV